jgi:hypothetical protein
VVYEGVREDEYVAGEQLEFKVQFVEVDVSTVVVATGYDATITILGFLDVVVYLCLIWMVASLVDDTGSPGSGGTVKIVEKWVELEIFECGGTESSKDSGCDLEDVLLSGEEVVGYRTVRSMFSGLKGYGRVCGPATVMSCLILTSLDASEGIVVGFIGEFIDFGGELGDEVGAL